MDTQIARGVAYIVFFDSFFSFSCPSFPAALIIITGRSSSRSAAGLSHGAAQELEGGSLRPDVAFSD